MIPVGLSVELHQRLDKIGVPAELHIYEYREHGFALARNRGDVVTSTVGAWSKRLEDWLRLRGVI